MTEKLKRLTGSIVYAWLAATVSLFLVVTIEEVVEDNAAYLNGLQQSLERWSGHYGLALGAVIIILLAYGHSLQLTQSVRSRAAIEHWAKERD